MKHILRVIYSSFFLNWFSIYDITVVDLKQASLSLISLFICVFLFLTILESGKNACGG